MTSKVQVRSDRLHAEGASSWVWPSQSLVHAELERPRRHRDLHTPPPLWGSESRSKQIRAPGATATQETVGEVCYRRAWNSPSSPPPRGALERDADACRLGKPMWTQGARYRICFSGDVQDLTTQPPELCHLLSLVLRSSWDEMPSRGSFLPMFLRHLCSCTQLSLGCGFWSVLA